MSLQRFQSQRFYECCSSFGNRVIPVCIALLLAFLSFSVNGAESNPGPQVGTKAPDFELPVQGKNENEFVSLSDLVDDGPVVVIVLRGFPGYQCPICNRQVGSLINRSRAFATVTGGKPNRVVLVYPGPSESLQRNASKFLGSRRLPEPFVLLRDPDMEMVTQWGLRWKAPRETAYPAAFVLDGSRRVRWAKVSDSHGGRATADEILKALNSL